MEKLEEVLSKKELPDLIAGLRKHVMGLVSADVLDPMQTEGGEANDETTESKQWCANSGQPPHLSLHLFHPYPTHTRSSPPSSPPHQSPHLSHPHPHPNHTCTSQPVGRPADQRAAGVQPRRGS